MELQQALTVFDALSQETRLRAYRLLVEAGPEGLAAGALGRQLATPHNTLSFHLSQLVHAGIVTSRKQGRSVIYAADFAGIRDLLDFLVRDCCTAAVASIRKDQHKGCSIIELAPGC